MENKKITFYDKTIEETYEEINSNEKGLTEKEAKIRLEKYGKNELKEEGRKSLFKRFLEQLEDPMIIVLIIAAFVSAGISIWEQNYTELFEGGLILFIVIINAIIGLSQESKAHEALEALKNMNKPETKVLRDGQIKKIKSEDVVIGDVVILEAGDFVPADLRVIETATLKVEEASLTGESLPVEKNENLVLDVKTSLGDRKNLAFSSSIVAYGRGKGVVIRTGMDTEVGKIAGMLTHSEKNETPLQVQLAKTAKYLSIVVLVIAIIIFIAEFKNISHGETLADNIIESFMTAVAIAVAAIPEGLPAVVTIVLAISVKRMSERKAIVRNLPAVETLGSCEVICSDKTGTLTLNKMTIKKLFTFSKGLYYEDKFDKTDESVKELLNGLILCNDTTFGKAGKLLGDPTETALVAYAEKIGLNSKKIQKELPRIDEIPFDSIRKMMTTIHKIPHIKQEKIAYTKGAFDMMLPKIKFILDGQNIRKITKKDIEILKATNTQMAGEALRILAFAYKIEGLSEDIKGNSEISRSIKENLEEDLIFTGLVGMIDPARKEVPVAIETCKKAGIEVVMITGDHLATAKAIAEQIGIYNEGDLAITGAELDALSDREFYKNLRKYRVFARVSPENKVRIVKAFKKHKLVVAMTGDGVNDAPSIKTSDIGIGMGITGTDVSKGAADIILADDNFATIVSAVEEGRKAYSNIQKAVQYLLSANIAEVLCLFIVTVFLQIPFLSAIMILWINLVTDSLPALALGTEKAEKDVMTTPPRKSSNSLFSGKIGKNIFVQGVMQTILTLTSFTIGTYFLIGENHEAKAITMAFITLSLIQLFHSYNLRSKKASLLSSNPFSNKFLNLSFLAGVVLIGIIVLVPTLQNFFGISALNCKEYLIAIFCAFLIIPFVEVQKVIERKS